MNSVSTELVYERPVRVVYSSSSEPVEEEGTISDLIRNLETGDLSGGLISDPMEPVCMEDFAWKPFSPVDADLQLSDILDML
jgi:hypothetical protein